jgi:hypothetical protein
MSKNGFGIGDNNGKPIRCEEFLNRMVEVLGITVE